MPFEASTSTRSLSLSILVANFVPTMHGTCNSLLTTAACDSNPPSSVMIAAAFSIAGINVGFVATETKISPRLKLVTSSSVRRICIFPDATPDDAT